MSAVFVADHPLISYHLTQLRNKDTSSADFRGLVGRLTGLLAYEVTKDLATQSTKVVTPIEEADGANLAQTIGIVPILRAGLGMVDPLLNLIPAAEVWHVGLYRDEETALPVEYYQKFPTGDPVDVAIVLDPMLATGGSATAAIRALNSWGVKKVKLCALIAASDGIDEIRASCPETQIYICTIDPILNERKFIVPGLGDAGDRIFNTRHN